MDSVLTGIIGALIFGIFTGLTTLAYNHPEAYETIILRHFRFAPSYISCLIVFVNLGISIGYHEATRQLPVLGTVQLPFDPSSEISMWWILLSLILQGYMVFLSMMPRWGIVAKDQR